MTTKQYLSQIIRCDLIISNMIAERMRYQDIVGSTTVKNSDERVQTSINGDKIGSFVTKIVDNEKDIQKLYRLRNKIVKQIENMPEHYMYQILYAMYVDDMGLSEISRQLKFSRSKAYRLYTISMDTFEKMYGKSYAKTTRKRMIIAE